MSERKERKKRKTEMDRRKEEKKEENNRKKEKKNSLFSGLYATVTLQKIMFTAALMHNIDQQLYSTTVILSASTETTKVTSVTLHYQ